MKNWTRMNSGLLAAIMFLTGSLGLLARSEGQQYHPDGPAPTRVATMATYAGCYIDQDDRDMNGKVVGSSAAPMSLAACQKACVGFKYAGLQNGYMCYCGNVFGKYGAAPESQCNAKCTGAATQLCGGFWRNSVYKIM